MRKQAHTPVRTYTPGRSGLKDVDVRVSTELKAVAVREREAAAYTGFTVAYLRNARQGRCDGPPFLRTARAVRYLLTDLDRWLASRRVAV